jgi:predicted peroxiredoxin
MTTTAIICNGTENKNLFPLFILGSAAIALGNEVYLFFTPIGAPALKKGFLETVKGKGLPDIMEMLDDFLALGGHIVACELCFDVHDDLTEDDMREGVEVVGATGFLSDINDATITFSF